MTINRRNILLGLGAIVGGGGALVGTGAFSTVSAARSVSVSTAGDGSAFLQLTSNSDYVTDDTSNDTLELALDGGSGTGFNENAVTTTVDAFTITNNAADGNDVEIGLSSTDPGDVPDGSNSSGTATVTVQGGNSEDVEVSFYLGTANTDGTNNVDASSGTVTLGSGEYVNVDVKVDTTPTSTDATETSESLYIVGI